MSEATTRAAPAATGGVVLSDEQRLAWLRLIRSENVGPAGIMAHSPQEMNPPCA
jgi:hypothetical protein